MAVEIDALETHGHEYRSPDRIATHAMRTVVAG